MIMKMLEHLKDDNNGQTSVEVILLIGSILVIAIICGTYIYRINLEINEIKHIFDHYQNSKDGIFYLNYFLMIF